MLEHLMDLEKSYDSLPNFTAADCEWFRGPILQNSISDKKFYGRIFVLKFCVIFKAKWKTFFSHFLGLRLLGIGRNQVRVNFFVYSDLIDIQMAQN
jgi:hypothetical protein